MSKASITLSLALSIGCGAVLLAVLPGCTAAPEHPAGDAAGDDAADRGDRSLEPDAAAPGRLFSGEILDGDGCVLMSVAEVAELAGVSPGAISTTPAMDCLFMWDGGGVALTRPSIHRSVEQAREQYAGSTQDLTAAQMAAGAAALGRELDAKAAAGEITDRQATIGTGLADSQSGLEVRNAVVAGIGDEASHDGNRVKLRVGNVIFDVAADLDHEFDLALSRAVALRAVDNLQQLGSP